jgi:hypothetical protein
VGVYRLLLYRPPRAALFGMPMGAKATVWPMSPVDAVVGSVLVGSVGESGRGLRDRRGGLRTPVSWPRSVQRPPHTACCSPTPAEGTTTGCALGPRNVSRRGGRHIDTSHLPPLILPHSTNLQGPIYYKMYYVTIYYDIFRKPSSTRVILF